MKPHTDLRFARGIIPPTQRQYSAGGAPLRSATRTTQGLNAAECTDRYTMNCTGKKAAATSRYLEAASETPHPCPVCLEPMAEPVCNSRKGGKRCKEKVYTMQSCGHTFHESCVKAWFSAEHARGKQSTCPMCRSPEPSTKSPKLRKSKTAGDVPSSGWAAIALVFKRIFGRSPARSSSRSSRHAAHDGPFGRAISSPTRLLSPSPPPSPQARVPLSRHQLQQLQQQQELLLRQRQQQLNGRTVLPAVQQRPHAGPAVLGADRGPGQIAQQQPVAMQNMRVAINTVVQQQQQQSPSFTPMPTHPADAVVGGLSASTLRRQRTQRHRPQPAPQHTRTAVGQG